MWNKRYAAGPNQKVLLPSPERSMDIIMERNKVEGPSCSSKGMDSHSDLRCGFLTGRDFGEAVSYRPMGGQGKALG
jgi:hypothetical protein